MGQREESVNVRTLSCRSIVCNRRMNPSFHADMSFHRAKKTADPQTIESAVDRIQLTGFWVYVLVARGSGYEGWSGSHAGMAKNRDLLGHDSREARESSSSITSCNASSHGFTDPTSKVVNIHNGNIGGDEHSSTCRVFSGTQEGCGAQKCSYYGKSPENISNRKSPRSMSSWERAVSSIDAHSIMESRLELSWSVRIEGGSGSPLCYYRLGRSILRTRGNVL
jgi:hypothetical protein